MGRYRNRREEGKENKEGTIERRGWNRRGRDEILGRQTKVLRERQNRKKEERRLEQKQMRKEKKNQRLVPLHGEEEEKTKCHRLLPPSATVSNHQRQQPRSLIPGNLLPFFVVLLCIKMWAIHVLQIAHILQQKKYN